eukprot:TRINITY_DN1044_c0_g1_i2.p1 TRINITY_DN1044_c0_g1~~TRINITY_DN1044_c0_g1_i2.p1  ORF type:complete len:603 (+),score=198.17 TRINITY_DN1044_c0_g1_i2:133-1941(+)
MFAKVSLLLALFACVTAELKLERVGRVQLPVDISEDGTDLLCWNVDLAEEVVYDPANVIAYVGGEEVLTVVDIADPTSPVVLDRADLGTPIADVQICGDIIAAVAYNSESDALEGSLLIFSPYNAVTGKIAQVNTLTICSEPDHLIFTPDCSKILVACSGKPGVDLAGDYINPEGEVAIIDTADIATAGQEAVTIAGFTSFNADADKYVNAGVRYIYRGQVSPPGAAPDTFSKDMEPEYIAASADGKTGYIILQTNNAMAYLDIEAGEITDVKGFGYKAWGEDGFSLDASDKDGAINMMPWSIRGLFTPDISAVFTHAGVEYIVTANEGDSKELFPDSNGVTEEWTEEISGSDLVDLVTDMELQMALNDSAMLGRLAFSNVDGAPAGGADTALYTYGGRSVSIWEAATLKLVWDSADILETIHKDKYQDIFNMDASDEFCPLPSDYAQYGSTQAEIVAAIRAEIEANTTADPDYEVPEEFEALVNGPADGFDARSDNKGPEPESVVVGMVGEKRILFVGNERTSTIVMFDITDPTSPTLIGDSFDGAIAGNWWDQLVAGTVAPIDPEGLLFISGDTFPTGDDIVMIASAVSGALYLYKVVEI